MTVPISATKVMDRVRNAAADDDTEDRVILCVEPEGLEVSFGYACGSNGVGTWVKITNDTDIGKPVSPDTVEGEIHECDPDVRVMKYSNSRFYDVAIGRDDG